MDDFHPALTAAGAARDKGGEDAAVDEDGKGQRRLWTRDSIKKYPPNQS